MQEERGRLTFLFNWQIESSAALWPRTLTRGHSFLGEEKWS